LDEKNTIDLYIPCPYYQCCLKDIDVIAIGHWFYNLAFKCSHIKSVVRSPVRSSQRWKIGTCYFPGYNTHHLRARDVLVVTVSVLRARDVLVVTVSVWSHWTVWSDWMGYHFHMRHGTSVYLHIKLQLQSRSVTADHTTTVVHNYKLLINNAKPIHSLTKILRRSEVNLSKYVI